MSAYEPRMRTAIDGIVWWVPYNIKKEKYSTLLCHGKYRTKKECQQNIDFCYEKYAKRNLT
jgi:hypothetical protein